MLNVLLGLLTGLLLGGVVCTTGVASPVFGPGPDVNGERGQPAYQERLQTPESPTVYLC